MFSFVLAHSFMFFFSPYIITNQVDVLAHFTNIDVFGHVTAHANSSQNSSSDYYGGVFHVFCDSWVNDAVSQNG